MSNASARILLWYCSTQRIWAHTSSNAFMLSVISDFNSLLLLTLCDNRSFFCFHPQLHLDSTYILINLCLLLLRESCLTYVNGFVIRYHLLRLVNVGYTMVAIWKDKEGIQSTNFGGWYQCIWMTRGHMNVRPFLQMLTGGIYLYQL